MSFKRIALVGAVAVSAMALVGGGYAAARGGDERTTLITTTDNDSWVDPYLSAQGAGGPAGGVTPLSHGAEEGVSTCIKSIGPPQSKKVTITVTSTVPEPTGTVKFTGVPNAVPLKSNGTAEHTYATAAEATAAKGTYSGDHNHAGCQAPLAP